MIHNINNKSKIKKKKTFVSFESRACPLLHSLYFDNFKESSLFNIQRLYTILFQIFPNIKLTDQPYARLLDHDYFIACGLQTKQAHLHSHSHHSSGVSNHRLSSRYNPYQPVILYVYNANKIISTQSIITPTK